MKRRFLLIGAAASGVAGSAGAMSPAVRTIIFGGLLLETQALLNAMTVKATATRAQQINRTIRALKQSGLWDKLDVLYLLAAHDEQAGRLNWKAPGTYTLTAGGSPTFTADRGFQGDGVGAYLSNTLNVSTANGQFALNSAVLGLYAHSANSVSAATDMLVGNARINSNAGPTAYATRVNDASAGISAGAPAVGHYAGRRNSAAGREIWKSGALVAGPDAVASTSLASGFFLLALNGASGFSNVRLSFAYAGGAPTDAQMVSLHTTLMAYLQQVGAA